MSRRGVATASATEVGSVMQLAPRHLVAIVVALSLSAVLTPVGVMAATGTLVNITDPTHSGRRARVSASGTFHVEQRAGVATGAVSAHWTADRLDYFKLLEATGPNRIAITEVSVSAHGPVSGESYGHNYVDVVAYIQRSGTAACRVPSAYVDYTVPPGYERKVLRRIVARNQQQTVQLQWNGPALVAPAAAAGKKVCVQLEVWTLSTSTTLYIGATGYRFR